MVLKFCKMRSPKPWTPKEVDMYSPYSCEPRYDDQEGSKTEIGMSQSQQRTRNSCTSKVPILCFVWITQPGSFCQDCNPYQCIFGYARGYDHSQFRWIWLNISWLFLFRFHEHIRTLVGSWDDYTITDWFWFRIKYPSDEELVWSGLKYLE